MNRLIIRSAIGLAAAVCFSSASIAASMRADLSATSVNLEISSPFESVSFRVSGEGHFVELQFGSEQPLAFFPAEHGLPDGNYTFEAVVNATRPAVRGDGAETQLGDRVSASGYFNLVGGVIADAAASEFGGGADPVDDDLQSVSSRDQQILDDLIVDGSICVGQDCVNGESFGFDTLRLKENNLRIKAQDTSNTASFPSRDWQLTFNDSSNGGANKFSIDDIDGGRTPFTIEASAPSHSLYVDDGGRIGFGTSTPVANLHVVEGNTPTLRLEQDGSNGFTPQIWDLAGNEANFFLRDATNGSQLPIQVKPGADTAALFIAADNNIGLLTSSPSEELHIRRTSGNAAFRLETTDTSSGPGGDWIVRSQPVGQLQFRDDNNSTIPMRIGPGANSNLLNIGMDATGSAAAPDTINITGNLFINGVDNSTPDYVFGDEYELESIEEHAEFMWREKHLPAVLGATTGEDGKAVINVSHRSQAVLEELEKAHIYIEQLNDTIKQLTQRLDALESDREE